VPVIARIDGYAFGAGLELAACCDFRIASERSGFGMQEVRLGIPSVVEAARLPSLIGFGRTRLLLCTGRIIDAQTALRWGLVEEVLPPAQLDAAVERCVAEILQCGPLAVRQQKRLIREWEHQPADRSIARSIDEFAAAWGSDEPRERMREFIAARRGRD
jgi:enoyl-CoA hydratase/carnithine racemase